MFSLVASNACLTTLLYLLFVSAAVAQLLGCDAVDCPVDEHRITQCKVGNATLKAVGIANMTTSLDPRPFTWTLGLHEHKGNSKQQTFNRNFYLGTPPSFQFNDTTGCALFFEGISRNLTALNGDQLDRFTCSDVLAESCVSDLITHTQSTFKTVSNMADDSTNLCNRLRDSIVTEPPSTCTGVKGSWGAVIAQSLTGDLASTHVDQNQCHPTTGQDYDLSLIASSQKESTGREWSLLAPILNAITPIMTILSKDGEVEVKLSCLKLVESRENQTIDSPELQGSASFLNSFPSLCYVLLAIGYFFVL